ncbi:hypothetical protein ATI61_104379 [Archangium gephyra]|uniref:Uncharacterized protein n=1 Tax=Archangium gephyra TaxID=48 RepID=A0AAC8TBR5_9BACT|nr:hypothetical protein [Archangium gephyra]AKJ00212.1 Hypothetical protein AA314_01838 [Archangium gephyra]REG33089.1 hypothetical protein ATI61_104379 [Archangium gephyra]
MSEPVSQPRGFFQSLGPGLAGAVSLTLVHQGARAVLKHPPRMDVLGMRSIKKLSKRLGLPTPHGRALYQQSLIGDLLSNTLYYALVSIGRPRRIYLRGAFLGALAGLGAVVLPPYLGLGERPSRARRSTAFLTVLWYTLGGLGSARAAKRSLLASATP